MVLMADGGFDQGGRLACRGWKTLSQVSFRVEPAGMEPRERGGDG